MGKYCLLDYQIQNITTEYVSLFGKKKTYTSTSDWYCMVNSIYKIVEFDNIDTIVKEHEEKVKTRLHGEVPFLCRKGTKKVIDFTKRIKTTPIENLKIDWIIKNTTLQQFKEIFTNGEQEVISKIKGN